ncbi:MAG: hypothetical protein A3I66_13675 [Burkholderiales bacterium RIFCSPLOWO2_02_FULL_57_36]|nr:MAG: hypothetical protein A3I66_13675 [Burkholderiales bacterium RIFCSPLOWO2_02_FULL_57_36]
MSEATKVVRLMERDPNLKKALQQAQGIFIIPDYGRAALGIGGRGGEGVALMKQGGKWSDPAFYNMGAISAGLQAGAEGGSIAMILTNQKAVDSFKQENNWSLNADAGLTVANWSAKAQAAAGKGDVIVWSNAKGLLGDVALSVSDINFDEDETTAFYGKQVTLQDVFNGKVKAPPQVAALKQALPAGSGGQTSGGSGAKSGGSGSAGGGASDSAPPYTKDVERPGAGTTGTGIGGPTGSDASGSTGTSSGK